jgi:hypothetical protein
VSLVVEVLIIAGGFVVVRWVGRKLRPRHVADAPGSSQASSQREVLEAFPCQLGDVVVRTMERDEAWLEGALVFEEQRPVAALFVAPEAGTDRALLAREAEEGVVWLSPIAPRGLVLTSDLPSTLEHQGVLFERSRRLPVRVRRTGVGAPPVGERAVVAEYAGPASERIVVVIGSEQTRSWVGVALGRGDYDVLPGGSAPT